VTKENRSVVYSVCCQQNKSTNKSRVFAHVDPPQN
jgi:hypothetical protein